MNQKLNKPLKSRRCAVCKEIYTPKRIGLKVTKVCLNAGCVLDYAQGIRAEKAAKEARKKKVEFYKNDIPTLKKKAQEVFNKYIRLRDKDLGCISCEKDKNWDGQWHAGHYKTVGAKPHLRFDPVNVNKQCSVCNNYLSGNLANYREGIRKKWGDPALKCLEEDHFPHEKPTPQYYQKIIDFYRAKVKEMQC